MKYLIALVLLSLSSFSVNAGGGVYFDPIPIPGSPIQVQPIQPYKSPAQNWNQRNKHKPKSYGTGTLTGQQLTGGVRKCYYSNGSYRVVDVYTACPITTY